MKRGAGAPMRAELNRSTLRVFGDFGLRGVCIDWCELSLDHEIDWSGDSGDNFLQICLNFQGRARYETDGSPVLVSPEEVGISIHSEPNAPSVCRLEGLNHRFFNLRFKPEFLRSEFQFVMDGLRSEVRGFCDQNAAARASVRIDAMPGPLMALRGQLLNPPVIPAAHSIWYESKITEILSYFLFQPEAPGELFCQQHHRVNRERCERVLFLLHRDMENPPSLQMLADEVGCSPFYLSRLFAQEIGVSIPKALRKLRIEKAAELLRDGGVSVTDAAMQVGYSSLGAFNKAFSELMGSAPGQFSKKL